MIDVGRPFSKPYRELIDSFEERIRFGVEQPELERHIFHSSKTAYELRWTAQAILRVSGLVGETRPTFMIFTPGVHYRFSNNRIIWLHDTEKPRDGGRLDIEYTYRERPAGLTDFNPGSVIGTLVRAAAREMKLIYDQMDEAYRRAFIDYAQGAALDNVVALLGIVRKPALPAQGSVTFYRKRAADQQYVIPTGTRVADESGRYFVTTESGVISDLSLDESVFHVGGKIITANRIAELIGVWLYTADPDTDPPLETQEPPFGESEREITLVDDTVAAHLLVRYVAKSITVPIIAEQPGPEGNVNAETIVIMPTPPTGIEGVVNEAPTSEGKLAESDDQLRQRAKFHLERLGNATLNAIKFAVLEVDGVEGVEVTDHSLDGTIPLGEVRINYFGGDFTEIKNVVDNTRAAGVLAVYSEITEILLSGTIYVLPDVSVPESAVENYRQIIIEAILSVGIGEPVSVRRLSALVYDVGGLVDVAEAQIVDESDTPIPDPYLIKKTELLRPDEANLHVVLLTALDVAGDPVRVGATNEITLRLLTETGAAEFNNYRLDLTVTVAAKLLTAPDQPPSFLSTLEKQITFTDSNTAQLVINDIEIVAFDAGIHNPLLGVTIAASAYDGLAVSETQIDLS